MLVYLAPDSSRVRIEHTPRYIVLESWALDFTPHALSYDNTPTDVQPATMYKYSIPLLRSIFSLLRILPAWKLARRLRRVGGSRNGSFNIQLRVDDGSPRPHDLTFGESLVFLCLRSTSFHIRSR